MSSGSISGEWTPQRTLQGRRQLRVLEALDQAKTQYYHLSAVFIAGMGFYTDAYDLFCIGIVTRLLGRIYYPSPGEPGLLPLNVNAAVSVTPLIGTFLGQIVFGWLGDKLGRKKMYGMTLAIMFVFSLASGLSIGSSRKAVIASLCFFRFWLGFGIGGDYPLSATIMAEYANTKTRGAFIAAVFAMQGLGILTGGVMGLILAHIFEQLSCSSLPCNVSTVSQAGDLLWRILFMLGAIPAAATFYYRMRMPETARYTALIERNANKAASDMVRVLNVSESALTETAINVRDGVGSKDSGAQEYTLMSREFVNKHGLHLLGTATSWFLLDIAFYSQNLFQSTIFEHIHWTPAPEKMNGLREVYETARAQSIVACCATLPGYCVTMFLVDRIGRKVIQLQGFIFMAIFMLAIAMRYETLGNGESLNVIIFLVLYSCTFFFANFGPNATTFIVSAELFPARLRATCHGISAASGKLGAIVGSFGFLYASQPQSSRVAFPYPSGIGPGNTFYILAGASALGAAFTLLIEETKGKSLEEISGENDFNFEPYDDKSVHPRWPSINYVPRPGHLHPNRSSSSSLLSISTPDDRHQKESPTATSTSN